MLAWINGFVTMWKGCINISMPCILFFLKKTSKWHRTKKIFVFKFEFIWNISDIVDKYMRKGDQMRHRGCKGSQFVSDFATSIKSLIGQPVQLFTFASQFFFSLSLFFLTALFAYVSLQNYIFERVSCFATSPRHQVPPSDDTWSRACKTLKLWSAPLSTNLNDSSLTLAHTTEGCDIKRR